MNNFDLTLPSVTSLEDSITDGSRSISDLEQLLENLSNDRSRILEWIDDLDSLTEFLQDYVAGSQDDGENEFPYNVHDLSDDADALASAGMGTDEDYGYFGEEW